MGKSYFVCYRKDHDMEFFNHRCNVVDSIFDSNAIVFKEKNNATQKEVVLAIIPIHNIAAIMRYEED